MAIDNPYWRHGDDLYARIVAKDRAEAAALHPDRTLFLSWPPHGQDVGTRILLAYNGNRLIYVGDGRGGGTGGQRDRVTVYERAGR